MLEHFRIKNRDIFDDYNGLYFAESTCIYQKLNQDSLI